MLRLGEGEALCAHAVCSCARLDDRNAGPEVCHTIFDLCQTEPAAAGSQAAHTSTRTTQTSTAQPAVRGACVSRHAWLCQSVHAEQGRRKREKKRPVDQLAQLPAEKLELHLCRLHLRSSLCPSITHLPASSTCPHLICLPGRSHAMRTCFACSPVGGGCARHIHTIGHRRRQQSHALPHAFASPVATVLISTPALSPTLAPLLSCGWLWDLGVARHLIFGVQSLLRVLPGCQAL